MQDTLLGPQGAHIRVVPLQYTAAYLCSDPPSLGNPHERLISSLSVISVEKEINSFILKLNLIA